MPRSSSLQRKVIDAAASARSLNSVFAESPSSVPGRKVGTGWRWSPECYSSSFKDILLMRIWLMEENLCPSGDVIGSQCNPLVLNPISRCAESRDAEKKL